MKLTTQEALFFERVGFKLAADPALSIEAGLQSVLADDQRLFEQFITMPDRQRAELVSGFSKSVYHTIRSKKGR